MSSGIIKYGISMDYISSWGYTEAIREIVQNFMDYGDYDFTLDDDGLTYVNDYHPIDTNFLKIGFTRKHNSESVGKHGEGLKMALLVLHRLKLNVSIDTYINDMHYQMQPTTYEDDMLGTCFGIEYQSQLTNGDDGDFTVCIEHSSEYDEMEDYFITEDTDIIFESDYGNIVDMPAGNIYVGGIFVTNFDDIPRSYDIKPKYVDLGRDRNFPSTYDLESYTGEIYTEFVNENEDALDNYSDREASNMSELPDSYMEHVKPTMLNGKMKFKHKNDIVPDVFERMVKNNREMQLKIVKLNDELTKRKNPYELLENFKQRYGMYGNQLRDFNSILEKSKKWI
jgi:hypothetical protein